MTSHQHFHSPHQQRDVLCRFLHPFQDAFGDRVDPHGIHEVEFTQVAQPNTVGFKDVEVHVLVIEAVTRELTDRLVVMEEASKDHAVLHIRLVHDQGFVEELDRVLIVRHLYPCAQRH
ncbi:hypothetical protein D3C74_404770 [compost metagenome]